MIFNMSGGGAGGGTSLNFKVVGGTSAPENPKENTIWVDTDTEITSYLFSAVSPNNVTVDFYSGATVEKTGYYVDSSGSMKSASASAYDVLFFEVPEKARFFTISASANASAGACHAFYDASGSLISTVARVNGENDYIIPDGVASIRISLRTNDTKAIYVTIGDKISDGMVWIPTGTSSPAEFNALKKNGITVYPLSAKQYVGGTWVSKTAKIYQNGAWKDFITYLYNKGDLCTDTTGGWKVRAWSWNTGGNGNHATQPTATYNDSSVQLYQKTSSTTNQYTGIWETVNDIDLTSVDEISFHVLSSSLSGNSKALFGVFNRTGYSSGTSSPASVTIQSGSITEQTYTVNVSGLTGAYSIGVLLAAYTTNITLYVDEIKLIKN